MLLLTPKRPAISSQFLNSDLKQIPSRSVRLFFNKNKEDNSENNQFDQEKAKDEFE